MLRIKPALGTLALALAILALPACGLAGPAPAERLKASMEEAAMEVPRSLMYPVRRS